MSAFVRIATAALCLSLCAAPAAASSDPAVKLGVDRWQQGDYAAAIAAWRGPAARGDADAQFNLAQAYKLGRGVGQDLDAALGWYRKAADQGHLQAQDLVGLTLFVMGRRAEAMPHIRKSAARGESRAMFILGTAHFNGDLAEKDWVKAYALMSRANATGVPNAGRSLATMDGYLSPTQREQALSLAKRMEGDASASRVAALTGAPTVAAAAPATGKPAAKPVEVAKPKQDGPAAAKPIRTVDLPPARAAQDPSAIPGYTPSVGVRNAPGSTSAPPVAAPSPAPSPAPASGGGWRIQVAAVASIDAGRKLWTGLEAKQPGLKAYQPYLVDTGKFVRVQAGPFGSAKAAEEGCALARKAGAACFAVKP